MRIALSIILFFLLLSVSIFFYQKEKDILSPIVIFCMLCMLRYCPGIAYIEENLFIIIDMEAAVITFIYFLIAFFSTILGYFYYSSLQFKNQYRVILNRPYNSRIFICICYIIGVLFGIIWIAYDIVD